MVIPNLLAPINGVTEDLKNKVQPNSLDAFKELAKVEEKENENKTIELPPLPGT